MSAVVVVGLGYVGLPLAMRAVAAGHEVTGYDTNTARVKQLEAGESYIEDVSADELAAALQSGRFHPSADADACTGFDVAAITVPTPLRDGLPDLGYVEAASGTLARYLRRGATVIVESTSYPGTTQEQVLGWLEKGSGLVAGIDFCLGYSPERIDPGNRTWTLVTTPKIVSGIDQDSRWRPAGRLGRSRGAWRTYFQHFVPWREPRLAHVRGAKMTSMPTFVGDSLPARVSLVYRRRHPGFSS